MGQPTDNSGEDAVTRWNTHEFEELYASVGDQLDQVPWARFAPNSALVEWLDGREPGGRALVVACGFGDDAEELARRGYEVTAFDLSDTAIAWCHKRFPESTVDYRVADLLATEWERPFDLVVELYTIQSLPLTERRRVLAALAAPVAPGGTLFVRCFARADDAPVALRPWPVSRAELGSLTGEGLVETSLTEDVVASSGTVFLTGVYTR
jgi:2-polyprenyl-3-methyl-5-hydroxy-6-metoxy-1,4-benzoquinol methylase